MRLLAFALLVPSMAFASADAPPEPPAPDMTRIEGPFSTADSYCSFRERQLDDDGDIAKRVACTEHELDDDAAPRVRTGQAIRAVRFVDIGDGYHVLVETSTGWYGRALVSASNGDGAYIVSARMTDLVGDHDDELQIVAVHSHEPCGCGEDLYHSVFETYACTAIEGELRCTDGIVTADHMHLIDVWEWDATIAIGRDGRVRRTITNSVFVPKAKLRALATPFGTTFHR